MSRSALEPGRVTRALQKASQLRALFHRLPHVAGPDELRLKREFEACRTGRRARCRIAAVRTGFRDAWRRADFEAIVIVASRSSPALIAGDLELGTYAALAREALERHTRNPRPKEGLGKKLPRREFKTLEPR